MSWNFVKMHGSVLKCGVDVSFYSVALYSVCRWQHWMLFQI